MDITSVISDYFRMWNERDPDQRRDLIDGVFADDAVYEGPLLEASGREGIANLATQLHGQLGGRRFLRSGDIDHHHNAVRYRWHIVPGPDDGDAIVASGVDVAHLNAEGQLQRVTAFLDMAPVDPGGH